MIVGGSGQNTIHSSNGVSTPETVDDSDVCLDRAWRTTSKNGHAGPAFPLQGPSTAKSNRTQKVPAATTQSGHLPISIRAGIMTYMSPGRRSPVPRRPPNTQFTTDATQLGGTLPTVNQTQSPADLQEAGVFWHDLGVYQAVATSGTLIVQLGTDGSRRSPGQRGDDRAPRNGPGHEPTMDSFGVDANGNLSVTYTINGEDSPPFSIGIYGSPDGRQAGLLPAFRGGAGVRAAAPDLRYRRPHAARRRRPDLHRQLPGGPERRFEPLPRRHAGLLRSGDRDDQGR